MRILPAIALCLMTGSLAAQGDQTLYRLMIHGSSSLVINGKTNVNKYGCAINNYVEADTLYLTAERGKGAYFKKGLVRLSANAFNCGKKIITKDFVETIQGDTYPYIGIQFVSFERVPKFQSSEEKFMGKMSISLANVNLPCEIRCSIVKDEQGLIHLRGRRDFTFSDFQLKAPTKMMGAIRVAEQIEINFHLVLTRL